MDKETLDEVLHEQTENNYLSFDKENDFRIMDIFIVNDQFTPLKDGFKKDSPEQVGLKVICALHMDWCIKRAIKKWGKEVFVQ